MRILFSSMVALVVFFSFTSIYDKPGHAQAVQLNIDWQLVQGAGTGSDIIHEVDSMVIYKKGDYFVYLVPYYNPGIMYFQNEEGAIIRDSLMYNRRLVHIVIFHENDSTGICYDSLTAPAGHAMKVDSFLRKRTFPGMEIYQKENVSLISFTYTGKKEALQEVYIPRKKETLPPGLQEFDSLYCYYTTEKFETEISFSPVLEKGRKMRLKRISFIYNEIPAGAEYSFTVPRRKMMWELKHVSLPDKKEIDRLLKRYKTERR
ncbi:MAG: hypothetical protein GC171_08270 [Terrimonas sp.]|nr:hypothetical protein [Terrimonas sp.]